MKDFHEQLSDLMTTIERIISLFKVYIYIDIIYTLILIYILIWLIICIPLINLYINILIFILDEKEIIKSSKLYIY